MRAAATFLFCVAIGALGVDGCGVEKASGTIAIGGTGGAGGFAGAAGTRANGAQGGAGGQAGAAAGGAAGHGPVGCGGAAPAAVPADCVPAIAVAPDGGPQAYPRCQAGVAATAEICDDSSAVYHCPFGYAAAASCGCFVHDIDQECRDAGAN